jgi:hypothetical protein
MMICEHVIRLERSAFHVSSALLPLVRINPLVGIQPLVMSNLGLFLTLSNGDSSINSDSCVVLYDPGRPGDVCGRCIGLGLGLGECITVSCSLC